MKPEGLPTQRVHRFWNFRCGFTAARSAMDSRGKPVASSAMLLEVWLQAPREYGMWIARLWERVWPESQYYCVLIRHEDSSVMTAYLCARLRRKVPSVDLMHAMKSLCPMVSIERQRITEKPRCISVRWDAIKSVFRNMTPIGRRSPVQRWVLESVGLGTRTLWSTWSRLPRDHLSDCRPLRAKSVRFSLRDGETRLIE